MIGRIVIPYCALLLMYALATPALADEKIEQAKKLFETYVEYRETYDSRLTQLYADDAVIQLRRIYPDGDVKVTRYSGSEYKSLIRVYLPLARARGYRTSFRDVRYSHEKQGVRVTASRFSERRKAFSPFSMLIRPDDSGRWEIHEEMTETRS